MRSSPPITPLSRRGFTVVELMLALILGAMIVASATAVFGLVGAAEKRLSASFDDASQLAIAQRVLRRSTSSLIAAKPQDDQATKGTAKARVKDEQINETSEESAPKDERAEEEASDHLRDAIVDATGDKALADALTSAAQEDRVWFELYYDTTSPDLQQALEVVVLESPVPQSREIEPAEDEPSLARFMPVRGVFETLAVGDAFVLQWRPIDPPGPPTLLLENLERVEWWVLPRARHGREWVDVWAAYLQEDYPVALRLLVWTRNGTHADWLFDTGVTTPDGT